MQIEWTNNMRDVYISSFEENQKLEQNYTKITFYPDKKYLKQLDKDIIALMNRRVLDIAGIMMSPKNFKSDDVRVKVYLNGTRIGISGFERYIQLYINATKQRYPGIFNDTFVYNSEPYWEIGVTTSPNQKPTQISYVNGISTLKGGTHVKYIKKQIEDKLIDAIQKKVKKEDFTPNQVKNNLWIFVNCLIENPVFDSQTKENMVLDEKAFLHSYNVKNTFIDRIIKETNILELIKRDLSQLEKDKFDEAVNPGKKKRIGMIEHFDDANYAGKQTGCTLIITEGLSARQLAVAGLKSIVGGNDYYGIFPLKGKLLNTREASSQQIAANAEIQNLIKIIGLNTKITYTENNIKDLRYQTILLMTDQDDDGSHIKGLVINFIDTFWPSLL